MDDFTPAQKKQLDNWAIERDLVLAEISINRIENERLEKINKDLAASNTEIADKIQQSLGRLEEMTIREKELDTLVSIESAELSTQKSELQASITGLMKEIGLLKENKSLLVESIEVLTQIHDRVFNRVSGLEKTLGEITQVSSTNTKEIESILIAARTELQRITDISAINVEKTNAVIHELPRIIFELQRDILERKKFNKIKV